MSGLFTSEDLETLLNDNPILRSDSTLLATALQSLIAAKSMVPLLGGTKETLAIASPLPVDPVLLSTKLPVPPPIPKMLCLLQPTDTESSSKKPLGSSSSSTVDSNSEDESELNPRALTNKAMGCSPANRAAVQQKRSEVKEICLLRGYKLDKPYTQFTSGTWRKLVNCVFEIMAKRHAWDRWTSERVMKSICQDTARNLRQRAKKEVRKAGKSDTSLQVEAPSKKKARKTPCRAKALGPDLPRSHSESLASESTAHSKPSPPEYGTNPDKTFIMDQYIQTPQKTSGPGPQSTQFKIIIQGVGSLNWKCSNNFGEFQNAVNTYLKPSENDFVLYMPLDDSAKEWAPVGYEDQYKKLVSKCKSVGAKLRKVTSEDLESEDVDDDEYTLHGFLDIAIKEKVVLDEGYKSVTTSPATAIGNDLSTTLMDSSIRTDIVSSPLVPQSTRSFKRRSLPFQSPVDEDDEEIQRLAGGLMDLLDQDTQKMTPSDILVPSTPPIRQPIDNNYGSLDDSDTALSEVIPESPAQHKENSEACKEATTHPETLENYKNIKFNTTAANKSKPAQKVAQKNSSQSTATLRRAPARKASQASQAPVQKAPPRAVANKRKSSKELKEPSKPTKKPIIANGLDQTQVDEIAQAIMDNKNTVSRRSGRYRVSTKKVVENTKVLAEKTLKGILQKTKQEFKQSRDAECHNLQATTSTGSGNGPD
ncbi:hypothetical protein EDC01DRAFT_636529 [Geopyxis carbonaria]|nr:hypothetical protein EDC01DRAFT_636529 [Geopyxis carbonaria]